MECGAAPVMEWALVGVRALARGTTPVVELPSVSSTSVLLVAALPLGKPATAPLPLPPLPRLFALAGPWYTPASCGVAMMGASLRGLSGVPRTLPLTPLAA